ncbi:site-2 protease family protein [Clostridium sp. BJN0001]|uniref:site-2 protease family protein n=1 Tax=Clostridium sp. BJN0001 TaxID=2930219 RepID=UPI001FD31A79|nr:site-2 protease family protein [Clostridium sp. BJN0001]
MNDFILDKILIIPAMLVAFTFHEYAHAFMADRLGDKTPRFQGRLTLNPLDHIDPLGFIAVLLCGFGWAKPVQVNPSAYKNYFKDDLKVSLAGPIANFIVSIIFAFILGFYAKFLYARLPYGLNAILYNIINSVVFININIGIFNLLPIPGLDGFSLFRDLFPDKFYKYENKFYQYQILFLIGIIVIGGRIISIPCNALYSSLIRLVQSLLF